MRVKGLVFFALTVATLGLVACGGDPEVPPPPPPAADPPPAAPAADPAPAPPPAAPEPPPPPPKKAAKEVVLVEGATYMFSLSDSADAKKATEDECGKKNKDEKKKEDCVQKAMGAAAGEGIRFEKNKDGKWTWVAFGKDKGDKEVVYNKVAFNVASGDAPDKLTVTPEGKDEGKKALKPLPKEMTFEVPDESTVVMNDAKRGKLVFKKKLARSRQGLSGSSRRPLSFRTRLPLVGQPSRRPPRQASGHSNLISLTRGLFFVCAPV